MASGDSGDSPSNAMIAAMGGGGNGVYKRLYTCLKSGEPLYNPLAFDWLN